MPSVTLRNSQSENPRRDLIKSDGPFAEYATVHRASQAGRAD